MAIYLPCHVYFLEDCPKYGCTQSQRQSAQSALLIATGRTVADYKGNISACTQRQESHVLDHFVRSLAYRCKDLRMLGMQARISDSYTEAARQRHVLQDIIFDIEDDFQTHISILS